MQQTGILSSVLEHAIPEQMFTSLTKPIEAVSAMKALTIANQQGQRTYNVTKENQLTTLPNINHDASTMSEISAALAVGKEVITHTGSISVPGWSGVGYIILDSETGEGAYKISGGQNGGVAFLDGYSGASSNVVSLMLLFVAFISSSALVGILPIFFFVIAIFHLFINLMIIDLEIQNAGCPDGLRALGLINAALFVARRTLKASLLISTFYSFIVPRALQGVTPACGRR